MSTAPQSEIELTPAADALSLLAHTGFSHVWLETRTGSQSTTRRAFDIPITETVEPPDGTVFS